jgi:hypothetical protein
MILALLFHNTTEDFYGEVNYRWINAWTGENGIMG